MDFGAFIPGKDLADAAERAQILTEILTEVWLDFEPAETADYEYAMVGAVAVPWKGTP